MFGFWIEKYKDCDPARAKKAMIASLVVSLSVLIFFKYYNFFAFNLSKTPFFHIPVIENLRLPIGISFYTFQIMSYTIDLYRRECVLQKNYVSFGTYVTLFPQLIAGPIVRYSDIDRQLSDRHENWFDFAQGVNRFCCGLSKKVLLGDALAAGHRYFDNLAEFEPTALGGWLTIILYTLHLYFDFSGYSDMAIGLGKMFGFHFPENFNYPYVSKSITEFWRRWHISLSTWFREYVYIPLGGNRRGRFKQYRNLAIVWLLTGFWHGAGWNFILWGVYYAVILICEKAFLLKVLDRLPNVVQHLYSLLLVVLGFLIFSFTDLSEAWRCFLSLFGIGCNGFWNPVVRYQVLRFLPLMGISAIACTPLPRRLLHNFFEKIPKSTAFYPILTLGSLLLCVAYLVDSTFSPFAYLQF